MTPEGLLTLAVIGLMLVALVLELFEPDVIVFGALGVLYVSGVLTAQDALMGFANKGLMTVVILFVVAYAMQSSGLLTAAAGRVMGDGSRPRHSLLRLMAPVVCFSAFLNNTPIVAMFAPTVRDWAIRKRLPPSKFLLPLSYASIFGGVCTLIGTSTNLVVSGLLQENGGGSIGLFELGLVGVPCAIAGVGYLLLVGYRLLPANPDLAEGLQAGGKQYLTEVRVEPRSPLVGGTVEQAGLRNLENLFLVEIVREGESIVPVGPTDVVHAGDHLVFSGNADAILDVQRTRGLVPCEEHQRYRELLKSGKGRILEAVVSHSSPMLSRTIKEGSFRARYDAVVLAIHRHGERIDSKIGQTVLRPGDTLLLLAGDDFLKQWNFSRDFYMITKLSDAPTLNRRKTVISVGALAGMVLLAATGVLDVLTAGIAATMVLLLTRCVTAIEARRSIEINVVVVIAAAFGISRALDKTGVAGYLAGFLIEAVEGTGPVGLLAAIYLATAVLTEVITNNAAAALVFPIAMAAAAKAGLNPKPFAVAIAIAASAAFSTPIGYQTNMMVYGPGGYRFRDFLKVGIPLNAMFMGVSLVLIPLFWKF